MKDSRSAAPPDLLCGDGSALRLEANLGPVSAAPFRQKLLDLLDAGNPAVRPAAVALTPVRVDASLVEHLGTSALQILLSAAAEMRASGGSLVLERPSEKLREWARIAGVAWLMPADPLSPSPLEEP